MHPPISTCMAPPHLSAVVYTNLKWIQTLSQLIGITRVPVRQESWVQCCKGVAWTDTISGAEWASFHMPLLAASIDTGLPCMLVFTPLRSAAVAFAEPPHLPATATGQHPCVDAIIFGGTELCLDVWQLDLHASMAPIRASDLRCLAHSGQPVALYTLLSGLAAHWPCSVHVQSTFFWL